MRKIRIIYIYNIHSIIKSKGYFMSFSTLGLCEPILRAIEEQGYTTPTPVQKQAIPIILEKRQDCGGHRT